MTQIPKKSSRILIIGGGFAGINAAKTLGNQPNVQVTLIDKCNYHLFQPLLYQVAMAGLTPAEIAFPIRSQLGRYQNIAVIFGNVNSIDLEKKILTTEYISYEFDFLIVACGATHSYFGKNEWQDFAPGMKSVEQALEIRRRILIAFEYAEREINAQKIESLLTFIVVGGGPTGVELAGSLVEMARFTLASDFRHIDPKNTKIILIEAGQRLLAAFDESSSQKAKHDLEHMGVTIKINAKVTNINKEGVWLGEEFIESSTVIWAAGVQPSPLGQMLSSDLDRAGRVKIENTLHLKNNPYVFVLGDQACFKDKNGRILPGLAAVAMQQGVHAAKNILRTLKNQKMIAFQYFDKGQMATIGRGRAIAEIHNLKLSGHFAWYIWLFIHILYLNGLRNKMLVFIRWMWSYFTFSRGSRLITEREWKI